MSYKIVRLMVKIRKISIKNFRCIEDLEWYPIDGINCIIGAGDTGKSTILDAIDICLSNNKICIVFLMFIN